MTLEDFIAKRAQVLDDVNAMSATIEHAAQIVANCSPALPAWNFSHEACNSRRSCDTRPAEIANRLAR